MSLFFYTVALSHRQAQREPSKLLGKVGCERSGSRALPAEEEGARCLFRVATAQGHRVCAKRAKQSLANRKGRLRYGRGAIYAQENSQPTQFLPRFFGTLTIFEADTCIYLYTRPPLNSSTRVYPLYPFKNLLSLSRAFPSSAAPKKPPPRLFTRVRAARERKSSSAEQ